MASDFVRPGRIDKLREELAKEKNEKIEIRTTLMRLNLLLNEIDELRARNSNLEELAKNAADKNRQIIAAWLLSSGDSTVTLPESLQHEAYRHALRVVIESAKQEDGTEEALFRFDPEMEPRELPAKPLAAVPPPTDIPESTEATEGTATSPAEGSGPRAVEDPVDSSEPIPS